MKYFILLVSALIGICQRQAISTDAPPSSNLLNPDESLTFDETLRHLFASYEGTQKTVPLLDTKAAAAITLSLGLFVFIGKLLTVLYDRTGYACLETHHQIDNYVLGSLAALLGIATISGSICLVYSFNAVKPNLPHDQFW